MDIGTHDYGKDCEGGAAAVRKLVERVAGIDGGEDLAETARGAAEIAWLTGQYREAAGGQHS